MRADRQDPDLHSLIDDPALFGVMNVMLETAERLETGQAHSESGPLEPPVLVTWLQREAHLALERFAHLIGAGVNPESAAFLAQDDPGFQIAKAAADWWDDHLPA